MSSVRRTRLHELIAAVALLVLAWPACGGGSGEDGSDRYVPPSPDVGDTADADVSVDGESRPTPEELEERADRVESENNDPARGGEANELSVEPAGERAIVTGTVEPPRDTDGDSADEQDVDVFNFSAEAGQWFEFSARSLGLPSPHAEVRGPAGFTRSLPSATQRETRQFRAPRTGDYNLVVAPAEWLRRQNTPPLGDSDWRYVAFVRRLAAPSARSLDLSTSSASGRVRGLTDNFYRIDAFATGDVIELTVDTLEDGVAGGQLQLWRDNQSLARRLAIGEGVRTAAIAPVSSSGTFFLLVDAQRLSGPLDAYEISGSRRADVPDLGTIDGGETDSDKRTIGGTTADYYRMSLPAGRIVEVSQVNADRGIASVQIVSDQGRVLSRANQLGDRRDEGDRLYYYTDTGRQLLVKVLSPVGGELTDAVLTVESIEPFEIGEISAGETVTRDLPRALQAGESGFHTFALSSKAEVDVFADAGDGNRLELVLYDADFDVLARNRPGSGERRITDEELAPGTYLVRGTAVDGSGAPAYDIRIGVRPP